MLRHSIYSAREQAMGSIRRLLLCLPGLLALPAGPSLHAAPPAAVGTGFVDGESVMLANRSWNGHLAFGEVYCVDFPSPERAHARTTGLLNGTAVALARVEYPEDRLAAFIVASTLPAGLSDADEHQHQLARARQVVEQLDGLVSAETRDSPLGPVIAFGLRNVMPERGDALFPLELEFYDAPEVVSWGETRVFSRRPDRLEVAVLAIPGRDATPAQRQQAQRSAAEHADRLLASLQRCTGAMPRRTP